MSETIFILKMFAQKAKIAHTCEHDVSDSQKNENMEKLLVYMSCDIKYFVRIKIVT